MTRDTQRSSTNPRKVHDSTDSQVAPPGTTHRDKPHASTVRSSTPQGSDRRKWYRWRTVDIVVGSVLGVACGILFFAYNTPGFAWYELANAVTPGLGGIANGFWLLGGPLGAAIIRKPGAAVFVEVVAGIVSMALGAQWGWLTIGYAFAQGLGAELVVLAWGFRRINRWAIVLSGAGAGVGTWLFSYLTGDIAKSLAYNVVYLSTSMISGAIVAGGLAWFLMKALARTGALERFPAGRTPHAS